MRHPAERPGRGGDARTDSRLDGHRADDDTLRKVATLRAMLRDALAAFQPQEIGFIADPYPAYDELRRRGASTTTSAPTTG